MDDEQHWTSFSRKRSGFWSSAYIFLYYDFIFIFLRRKGVKGTVRDGDRESGYGVLHIGTGSSPKSTKLICSSKVQIIPVITEAKLPNQWLFCTTKHPCFPFFKNIELKNHHRKIA